MVELDLTVMAVDGPLARAYLDAMRRHGFRPRTILVLHLASPNPLFQKVKRVTGPAMADKILTLKKYVQRGNRSNRAFCKAFAPFIGAEMPNYFGRFSYKRFASSVRHLHLEELNSPALRAELERLPSPTVLFTGGGILKKMLLETPGRRFVHVHPGVVPDVKGSDGLFWSLMVRGKPGYSCFYMNAGIDTGDIIATREFAVPRWSRVEMSHDALYHALLLFFDPILRARTLMDVLKNHSAGSVNALESTPQHPSEGRTFYFMHPKMRNALIDRLEQGTFKAH